jgi:hypothetical protein
MTGMDSDDQSDRRADASRETAAAPSALATYALEQQQRIERMLKDAGLGRRGLDPELVKNLRIVWRLLEAVIELESRQSFSPPGERRPGHGGLAQQEGRLRTLITLPFDESLSLPALLGRRFALEQLLIEVGDETYLTGRLAEVYSETEGTHVTWREVYGQELPGLLPGRVKAGGTGPEPDAAGATRPALTGPARSAEVELTRLRLARLMRAKEADDQTFRVRWELKRQAAGLVVGSLAAVVAALVGVLVWLLPDDAELFACTLAGTLGATLGGLIRLRDQIELASHIRQFRAFFLGQVLVGATAGLVTLLITRSGVVAVRGGSQGATVAAFAVGFSEAAFISLISRLGVGGGEGPSSGPASS